MLNDVNIKYMNSKCDAYCRTVYCDRCLIGDALTAATRKRHRCGNGYSFTYESMNAEEIAIAYEAIREG